VTFEEDETVEERFALSDLLWLVVAPPSGVVADFIGSYITTILLDIL
jgi:hypothetical protein